MSTSLNAIIRKGVSLEEIKTALEKKFARVEIETTSNSKIFRFKFKRRVWCFFNDYAKNDYGIDGTLFSTGIWGNANEILIYLCETFGGYIQEEDETFTPINFELFSQGTDLTPHDLFVNKVIFTLGYDNLKKTLALFEEFKKIQ